MWLNLLKKIIFSTLIPVIILPAVLVFAQLTPQQEMSQLERELKELQEEMRRLDVNITRTEAEKQTRQYRISTLRNRINQLDLEIRRSNLIIKDLGLQILDTESSIEVTSLKIEKEKERLAQILKTIYEEDQKSLLEVLIGEASLSVFFDNLMTLETLNKKNHELLDDIKALKLDLEKQKQSLNDEKDTLGKAVQVQQLQKQQSEETRQEQERLLRMTEAQYQQYAKEKQELERRVSEIMARITQLTLPGLEVPRDRKELASLASWAGQASGGVRPALILGLIEVESALGTNVGQCNCAGQSVCRHPELTYKQVMRSNQWSAFEKIVAELGLNINTTPVSCSVQGGTVQWGGAMGPAQFMPTTWLNFGYKQRVENITGVAPANPWRASDAFLAAALYLADWNAQTQTRASEIGAITAYLCGTSAMTESCRRAGGEWYRNSVLQKADQWQVWINNGL